MQLSTHITLDEFTESTTARRRSINNDLPIELHTQAKATAAMLERIRSHLCSLSGKSIPINITSGYRCLLLNQAIGSRSTSDHVQALACDFKAPEFGDAHAVSKALSTVVDVLSIGQLIFEFSSWVHVSTRIPDKIINRILTIDGLGVRAGIREG